MSRFGLEHEDLFESVVSQVKEFLQGDRESTKVIEFHTPDELAKLVDFQLQDEGIPDDATVSEICKTVLNYSVHTRHPHFYNQLFTGADEVGLMASFMTVATNTNMYTFEMAPVFSLMEKEVLCKLRHLVGWEGGRGDGIFSPGGSISNLYSLILARYQKYPQSKTEGIHGLPQMAIFCSDQSHYSVVKGSFIMGIGANNVVKIKTDHKGKMIPEELEKALTDSQAKGVCPISVIATAATTVFGAFDPLEQIAAICQRHSVWMHVDGSFGASILMSQKHKGVIAGIERADSVTWNPHKSLRVPQQCSAFLTRHEGLMNESNSTGASYLFQKDKLNYDTSYDTGDKSIQCGRLNDVFKFWLMWKVKGKNGFEESIDDSLRMARYLAERIKNQDGFQLVVEEPEYTNVCFWYFPPKMRDLYPITLPISPSSQSRLSQVAPIIKAHMIKKGSVMITYQPLRELPNFFRMTLTTPTSEQDMDWILTEIEALGSDIDI